MEFFAMEHFIELDLSITDISTAAEKKCSPTWTFEVKDGRNSHGIVLVLGGKAVYRMEKGSLPVEKGDIVFLPKGSKYWSKSDEKDLYHFIVISFNINNDRLLAPIAGKNIFKASSTLGLSGQFYDLSRLWFYKGIAYRMKCKSLLTDILYQLIRHSIQEEMHLKNYSRIQSAVSYMERYYDHEISLRELADMSHLSESHFRRLFKEIYQVSPVEYLNFIRINKAKDLIMSEMYSIGEIAEKTGYPNIYYFSRVFKKYTGLSPKHFNTV